jgi:hypothetical protein
VAEPVVVIKVVNGQAVMAVQVVELKQVQETKVCPQLVKVIKAAQELLDMLVVAVVELVLQVEIVLHKQLPLAVLEMFLQLVVHQLPTRVAAVVVTYKEMAH